MCGRRRSQQQGCPERRPSARYQHVDAVLLEVRAALGADDVGDDRIDRLQRREQRKGGAAQLARVEQDDRKIDPD